MAYFYKTEFLYLTDAGLKSFVFLQPEEATCLIRQ